MVNGWINRSSRDIKFTKPKSFEELETWDQGHTHECFHNLDIEVINAEIKALHYSAQLFYEKTEVKTKMHSILQDFAVAKLRSFKDWKTKCHVYSKTRQLQVGYGRRIRS